MFNNTMPTSITDWVAFAADLIQALGLPLAIIALFLTWQQVKQAKTEAEHAAAEAKAAATAARAQFMLALDEAFDSHRDMRDEMDNPDWTPTSATERNYLGRYIGVFERLGLLVQEI